MPAFIPAGNDSTTLAPAIQLFAGEAPITTNRAEGGTNVNLAQYTVIAIVGDKIVQYNPAGSDGSEKAAGILATPLNTNAGAGGVAGSWAPYYTGGDFNHAALVWPAATDTFAERRAAFAPTSTIKISKVL
jgi:hypothetical protein